MNSLIKVYLILDRTEQKALHRLLVWVMFMAMLDTLGVVSIMPFMAMLASPEIISTNKFLAAVYTYFMFENHLSFLLFTGSLVLMVFLSALAFKAYVVDSAQKGWLPVAEGSMPNPPVVNRPCFCC